jgi:hypothetical protein
MALAPGAILGGDLRIFFATASAIGVGLLVSTRPQVFFNFIRAFVIGVVLSSVVLLLAYFEVLDLTAARSYSRVSALQAGLAPHRGIFSHQASMVLLLLIFQGEWNFLRRQWRFVAISLVGIAMLVNEGRSGFASLIAACIVLVVAARAQRVRVVVAGAIVACVGAFLIGFGVIESASFARLSPVETDQRGFEEAQLGGRSQLHDRTIDGLSWGELAIGKAASIVDPTLPERRGAHHAVLENLAIGGLGPAILSAALLVFGLVNAVRMARVSRLYLPIAGVLIALIIRAQLSSSGVVLGGAPVALFAGLLAWSTVRLDHHRRVRAISGDVP